VATVRSGKPVVYLAEHSALALVESLANLTGSAASLPRKYQLIKVEVPAPILAGEVEESALPDLWREDFETSRLARRGEISLAPNSLGPFARVVELPAQSAPLRRQADPDRMVPLDRLR